MIDIDIDNFVSSTWFKSIVLNVIFAVALVIAEHISDCVTDSNDQRNQRTVFVKNLPYSVTEDQIAELFEGCTQVRLPLNDEGQVKG